MDRYLFEYLKEKGADLVSSADLRELPKDIRDGFDTGISITVKLDSQVIPKIASGPTLEYHTEFDRVNNLLKSLGQCASDFLQDRGYETINLAVTDFGIDPETLSTLLPHKTVATKSGLGWIGKNALLVTRSFGSAVRLTTVLTNADLPKSVPIQRSYCGNCTACVDSCPGSAPLGENWEIGSHRDNFFDAWSCRKTALNQSITKTGIRNTICGICISVCPWTKKYIRKSSNNLMDHDGPKSTARGHEHVWHRRQY
jgi:epoxyqueuosine reductase QueG